MIIHKDTLRRLHTTKIKFMNNINYFRDSFYMKMVTTAKKVDVNMK